MVALKFLVLSLYTFPVIVAPLDTYSIKRNPFAPQKTVAITFPEENCVFVFLGDGERRFMWMNPCNV